MKYLYFYAGIIPGNTDHSYVSGTLTLDARMTNDEQYKAVLATLEEAYGPTFSMINFNYMGEGYE